MDTVAVLKALADETRLRIVNLLVHADELCACEIEAVLDLTQSNASRHLARLRSAGIVTAAKQGHWVHYAIARSSSHASLLPPLLDSLRDERQVFRDDLLRLRDYTSSGFTCATIDQWTPQPPR